MNSICDNTYNKISTDLKYILEGCDTVLDAIPFSNYYIEKHPDMKHFILSLVNGKTYIDSIDIKSKQNLLHDVQASESREDASDLISKLSSRLGSDDVYKRTMERLANRKQHKNELKTTNKTVFKKKVHVTKKCPHCNHQMNMPESTEYVICGYGNPNQGYDWNGCGKDWCFQCEKLLCKSWEVNRLHFEMNRVHTDECCSKHAHDTGKKYPENYCHCNNLYVNRDSNDIIKNFMTK